MLGHRDSHIIMYKYIYILKIYVYTVDDSCFQCFLVFVLFSSPSEMLKC